MSNQKRINSNHPVVIKYVIKLDGKTVYSGCERDEYEDAYDELKSQYDESRLEVQEKEC